MLARVVLGEGAMRLLLRRNQRAGSFSGNMIFCLDARAEFAPEEKESIRRYRLGGQVIYNSEASKRALARSEAADDGSIGGSLKGLAYAALAAMKLNITIDSLERGQHIECKSLDELLGAEDAIMTACENLRGYLETAATFDGREVVVDFSTETPQVIAQAPALPPPRSVATPLAPMPEPVPAPTLRDDLGASERAPGLSAGIPGTGTRSVAASSDQDENVKLVLGAIAVVVVLLTLALAAGALSV